MFFINFILPTFLLLRKKADVLIGYFRLIQTPPPAQVSRMANYSYDPFMEIYTCNSTAFDPDWDCKEENNPCTKECFEPKKGWLPDEMEMMWSKDLSIMIYGRIFPALCCVTVISNFFIVAVLSRKHMRTPTNSILFYMAIADLCVAVIPFPFCFHYVMLENYKHMDRLEAWWCWMSRYLTDALPPLCHNVAIWLTVLLAGQRLIYVQYPLSARKWCTVAKVRWATLIICSVSLICASPKFFDIAEVRTLKYRLVNENGSVQESFKCVNRFSAFYQIIGSNVSKNSNLFYLYQSTVCQITLYFSTSYNQPIFAAEIFKHPKLPNSSITDLFAILH